MPLLAGSRLGPYEILSPIGAGGMGEVYHARDPRHFVDSYRHDPEVDRLLDRPHDGARPPAAGTGPGGPIA